MRAPPLMVSPATYVVAVPDDTILKIRFVPYGPSRQQDATLDDAAGPDPAVATYRLMPRENRLPAYYSDPPDDYAPLEAGGRVDLGVLTDPYVLALPLAGHVCLDV